MTQFWRISLSSTAFISLAVISVLGQTAQPNRRQALYDQYYGVKPKAAESKPLNRPKPTVAERPAEPIKEKPASEPPTAVVESSDIDLVKPAVQVSAQTRVRIGARGGILTPVLLNNNTPFSAATDFTGGVVLVAGNGRVQFQPEINYSRATIRNRFLGTGITRSATDQVVIPLLARLSFGHLTGNQVYINAGPYGAYETSTSLNGLKIPFDQNQTRTSVGVVAGLGIAIRTGPGHIGLDLRGRYRLTNTTQVAAENRPDAVYTEATLSYLYPLGRR